MKENKSIEYPHIRGAGVIIPDCSRGVYTPFRITSREKRSLVKKIAEKGMRGIDDFIDELKKGDRASEHLESIRKKLEKDLERIRSRKRGELDDQVRRLTKDGGISARESSDGLLDESGFRRFASDDIRGEILASELIGALEGRLVTEDYVEKKSLPSRIWTAIKRFFVRIFSGIMRFLRWLRGLMTKKKDQGIQGEKRAKGAISLPFPSLERDLEVWEREMERKIDQDENLQRAVNTRLSDRYGFDTGRIRIKKASDPDWYRKEAKKILREEVKERSESRERDLERKRNELIEQRDKRERESIKRREEIMRLRREFKEDIKEKEEDIQTMSKEELKKDLVSSLSSMGYLKRTSLREDLKNVEEQWEVTEALVEKFSELIYAELHENRRGLMDRRGRHVSDAGVYEKSRPRMSSEESRMDILQTMVNARMNHPKKRGIEHDDMIILREVTKSELHGVIIMDISGSMDENRRIDAAKRSVLALTQAIKRENPRNKVDIIALSTRARPISLKEVMEVRPRGFTNHQEALAQAKAVLQKTRADRRVLFLITDGLPEAYLDEKGEAVAGDLEKAMQGALTEASHLSRLGGVTFDLFLLEPENEDFVRSARRIAREGGGKVITADPQNLAERVMGSYEEEIPALEGI